MSAIAPLLTPELGIAAIAAVLAAAIRGYSGFGADIIWAPVSVLVFGSVEAVTIMGITGFVAAIPICLIAARDTDWRELWPIFCGHRDHHPSRRCGAGGVTAAQTSWPIAPVVSHCYVALCRAKPPFGF